MGLRFTSTEGKTALYDSVTEWAFGPVFGNEEAAERFLAWAETQGVPDGDVRSLPTDRLVPLWESYCKTTENPYE